MEELLKQGYIHPSDPACIFRLTPDMIGDNGQNIYNAIIQSKETTLPRFIFALGIRGVGVSTAKLLAEYFGDIHSLHCATVECLMEINDIGETTANSICDYFELGGREVVYDLLDAGVKIAPMPKKGTKLQGLTFVITGTLPTQGRDAIKAMIEKEGGIYSGSVSKNTDYLIAGEEAGSKLKKAEQLGVKVIDEAGFLAMLE